MMKIGILFIVVGLSVLTSANDEAQRGSMGVGSSASMGEVGAKHHQHGAGGARQNESSPLGSLMTDAKFGQAPSRVRRSAADSETPKSAELEAASSASASTSTSKKASTTTKMPRNRRQAAVSSSAGDASAASAESVESTAQPQTRRRRQDPSWQKAEGGNFTQHHGDHHHHDRNGTSSETFGNGGQDGVPSMPSGFDQAQLQRFRRQDNLGGQGLSGMSSFGSQSLSGQPSFPQWGSNQMGGFGGFNGARSSPSDLGIQASADASSGYRPRRQIGQPGAQNGGSEMGGQFGSNGGGQFGGSSQFGSGQNGQNGQQFGSDQFGQGGQQQGGDEQHHFGGSNGEGGQQDGSSFGSQSGGEMNRARRQASSDTNWGTSGGSNTGQNLIGQPPSFASYGQDGSQSNGAFGQAPVFDGPNTSLFGNAESDFGGQNAGSHSAEQQQP